MPSIDIWAGNIESQQLFDEYIFETYSDDDSPISQFAIDQNEWFYDHDFIEFEFFGEPKPLDEVLKLLSFSDSFYETARQNHNLPWIPNCIFADLDDQFESPQSVEKPGISIIYLGKFEYDIKYGRVGE